MKNNSKKSISAILYESTGKTIKANFKLLTLLFITLLVASFISFIKTSTSSTVSSFKLDDYEIGQIADITIRATNDIPADYENPINITKGEKVIKKGFPITEDGYAKLKKMSESPTYIDYRAFANSIIYHILLCFLFFSLNSRIYFGGKKPSFKELVTECVFFMTIFASTMIFGKYPSFTSQFGICTVLPSALCVFLVAILFGQLNAVFFSLIASLSILNATAYQIVPSLFVLTTSLSAARIVRKINRRSDMVFVAALQGLLNVVFMVIFMIIFNSNLTENIWILVAVALNGFFSGIFCLGLLTPLELLLNTSSLFRLMDLSDQNSPIMKQMLVTASGTYSHSLMVASLAEAACNEIGANPLLARVGAYYHDIGKIDNPEYFVENQTSTENLHDDINPSLSVSIIRSHVKHGVEKARSMRLPEKVVNIIKEHHGNQVIAYFYNEAKQLNPDASPEDYSYTGNPPTSRESAIVMLADTVEAACRTLDKPSVPRLDKFILTLIQSKIDHKQLENCDLTFSDISKIHDAFVQILAGYYHSRTKYPDQKDPDTNLADASKETQKAQGANDDRQTVAEDAKKTSSKKLSREKTSQPEPEKDVKKETKRKSKKDTKEE